MVNFNKAGDTVLLLSGDHLYRMDFQKFINFHNEKHADITLAVVPVERSKVSELGIMKLDHDSRVEKFVEKPTDKSIVDEFEIPEELHQNNNLFGDRNKTHVGSMGIYIFSKKVLFDLLEQYDYNDFGKQIIPAAISDYKVYAYPFNGYWEDIGTIKSFFDAHIDMTKKNPPFNFYDQEKPIFTRPRFLPAAKISGSTINSSIVCEGSMIEDSNISDSILGLRAIIRSGSKLSKVILMGADFYETDHDESSGPGLGIGKNCIIENAIIDKDVRIGDDVQLINRDNIQNGEKDGIIIREGIIIVPKSLKIRSGFQL